MKDSVLVAGATGRLGREVVRELKGRGHTVYALARNAARLETLRGWADGLLAVDALNGNAVTAAFPQVDRVFSCLGASVIPSLSEGRRSFTDLDYQANKNLIEAALAANVRQFVYVSLFGAERLPQFDFVRGHELVVQALRSSGLDHVIVRPTGFFSSMEEIVLVASCGLLPEFRQGVARTNPIHEADLAAVCADVLEDPRSGYEIDVGGPQVLTRRRIAQIAFEAVGKQARFVRVPVGLLRSAGCLARPFNPRVGHLMTFIAAVLSDDFVAPAYGSHKLSDYFTGRAQGRPNLLRAASVNIREEEAKSKL